MNDLLSRMTHCYVSFHVQVVWARLFENFLKSLFIVLSRIIEDRPELNGCSRLGRARNRKN